MKRSAALVAAVLVADAMFIVTAADAQISPDWNVCSGKLPTAQPDQRVAACTAIIKAGAESPTNLAVAYCSRGAAYQARDQLDRAIADYNESVRIAPKSAASYLCRGFSNLAQGALDAAISDFNEASALDPSSAKALEGHGRAYRAKGDLNRQSRTMTRRSVWTRRTLQFSTTAA